MSSTSDLRDALGAWDLPPAKDLAPLTGGFNARVWKVRAGAMTFVAKAAHMSALHPGLEVAEFLSERDFPAGAPLRTRTGELTVAISPQTELALMRFVPGRPLGVSNEDLARRGRALARAHALLRAFASAPIERRWPWSWLTDFEKLPVSTRLRTAIERALRRAEELVGAHALTMGVLHGDAAGPDFLLEEAAGRIGLVDWGAVAHGPLLYDVGTVCGLRHLEGDRRRIFVTAYLEEAPLREDELAFLDDFVRLRWVVQARYFSWRIAQGVRTGIASDRENRSGLRDALRALGIT
jgi:Ser/Thr protein kinase RdoA (MazF antagonist)